MKTTYFKVFGCIALVAILAALSYFLAHTRDSSVAASQVVNGALHVGIASFTGKPDNADSTFITATDPTTVTNSMTLSAGSSTATIGFSSLGGGYINSLTLSGTGDPSIENQNVAIPDYGRGWQSSIRDNEHAGFYNPNQAGSHQASGTETTLTPSSDGKTLSIGEFMVALFQDNEFNVPNIQSEFDLSGAYANVSQRFGIPALQYDYAWGYVRPPDAILQYTDPSAEGSAKGNVINSDDTKTKTHRTVSAFVPSDEVEDVSPTEPGNQTANPTDLSGLGDAYSLRLTPAFDTVMWTSGAQWKSAPMSPSVLQCSLAPANTSFTYVGGNTLQNNQINGCSVDNGLVMLSTGTDPDTSYAAALYYPLAGTDGNLNTLQTWVVNANTLQTEAREDRSTEPYFRASIADGGSYKFGIYDDTAGLRSPTSLTAEGLPGSFELISRRVYILFGTPNQIRSAVLQNTSNL